MADFSVQKFGNLAQVPDSKYSSLEDFLQQEGLEKHRECFISGSYLYMDVPVMGEDLQRWYARVP